MDNNSITILSFYSFVTIVEPEILLSKILLFGKKKYIRGTILIAQEGFNGSISGTNENVKLLVDEIRKITLAQDIDIKVNYYSIHPFQKLKVKLKKEIIAMEVNNLDVNTLKGEYINSKNWDDFINQDDVVLVDTRNDYEFIIGAFKNAISLQTETFKQFPKWVEKNRQILEGKKIAMYCTGGIRCEKSTSYLRKIGFNNVYHLKGGILKYLKDTGNKNNLWQGECFVFDDRRAVTDGLFPAKCYCLNSSNSQ